MTKKEFMDYYYVEAAYLLDKQYAMNEREEHAAADAYFDGILALQRLCNKVVKELDEV